MMNLKLNNSNRFIIAIDLDETLLNSDGIVTDFTLKVLKECKKQNCILVISSARGYGSCKDTASLIDADFVCCQAGNMIADNQGNVIYHHGFSKTAVAEFIEEFRKYVDYFVIDSDMNLYGGDDGEFAKSWNVQYCTTEELLDKTAYKICVPYQNYFKDEIVEFCKAKGYVCREMRGGEMLLITPAGSDKFYALEKLLEILNSDTNHLIVFGDDTSDMLSIQKAGFGVAMENSREEVKKNAEILTCSNDEDGVAKYLVEKFSFKV